jgi:hypothetical protein
MLKDTPIPTILVFAGIGFLLLAVAGQLAGRIAVAPERQRGAAVIGGVLLAAGIVLHVVPQAKRPLPGSPPGQAAFTWVPASRSTASSRAVTPTLSDATAPTAPAINT